MTVMQPPNLVKGASIGVGIQAPLSSYHVTQQHVSEPIQSLPQGCVWCIRCNHAIVHCNWIGDRCRWSRLNPLNRESVNRCEIRSIGVITSAPTAHIKTPVTANLGWRPVRPGFPLSPPPSTPLSSLQSEQASGAARQVVPVQRCVYCCSPSPSSGRSAAGGCGLPRCPPAPVLHRRPRATSPVLNRSRHCVACNSAGSGPPPMLQMCSL
jgi:hypothetical protein